MATLPTPPSTSSPSTFAALADAFIAALPGFQVEMNALAAAMTLNATTDTSATSNAIGTGAKTFTVTAGKSFWPGMWLIVADSAAPTTNAMFCQVTSYSGTTLVVNSYAIQGSGTKTSWWISQSAPAALEGLYATLSASNTFSGAARFDSTIGVGAAGATQYGVHNAKALSGNVSQYGYTSNVTGGSDGTTGLAGYDAFLSTAAAAYTVANVFGFRARGLAVGAGSTATAYTGFYADPEVDAGSNYAFRGLIASGASNWNCYMSGTASNYFAGNVGIGTSTLDANHVVTVNGAVKATNTAKAWVNFNGTGTVAIRSSHNVTSITDNGVGDYTVNLTNATITTNSAVAAGINPSGFISAIPASTSAITVNTFNGSSVAADFSTISVIAFGL